MKAVLKEDKRGYGLIDYKFIILTLIILGMLSGIGLYVLGEMRYQVDLDQTATNTNESNINVTHTGTEITNATLRNCVINSAVCINASTNTLVASGNYSTTACTLTLLNHDDTTYNASLWNCTTDVSYSIEGSAASAVLNASEAGQDLIAWLPLIVVIIAAAIIIIIVLRQFTGKGVA